MYFFYTTIRIIGSRITLLLLTPKINVPLHQLIPQSKR